MRIAVDRRQMYRLPRKLLEMIIFDLVYDALGLKPCTVTCFVWYTVVAPHFHRTLDLELRKAIITRKDPKYLTALHELGLSSLVKKVQLPEIFDSESLRYFSALVNVQDLFITSLDFFKFTLGIQN